MRPLTPKEGMQKRWTDGSPMNRMAARFIKPNDRLTSFERLEIYNRQYWFRILSCFQEDYPGLRAILGDRRFEALSREYLARYPSISFTLRNLGSRLVRFLTEEPRWIAPRVKLALDMARFEWAKVVAFDGEARPIVHSDDLLGLKPSEIRLRLQPYLTLLKLGYPVDDFLIEIKKRDQLRSEASNAARRQNGARASKFPPLPKPSPIHVAVHRQNDTLYYKRLEPEAFQILENLSKGASLEKACLRAFARTKTPIKNQPAKVREWFQDWASLGWFCWGIKN